MSIHGRILVLDDNQNLRKTMKRIFSQKGYDVLTLDNNTEELKNTERRLDFDLVFMDFKVPLSTIIDNYSILKQINPKSTIIMITDYSVEDLNKLTIDNDKYDLTCNPVQLDEKISIVNISTIADTDSLPKNYPFKCFHKPLDMVELFSIANDIMAEKVVINI